MRPSIPHRPFTRFAKGSGKRALPCEPRRFVGGEQRATLSPCTGTSQFRPPGATDGLLDALNGLDKVITLSISSSSVTAARAGGGRNHRARSTAALRLALAVITRHRRQWPRALLATGASLALIVLAGVLTMLVLRAGGAMALRDTSRIGIDVGMVLVACLVVFACKQRFVHGSRLPPR